MATLNSTENSPPIAGDCYDKFTPLATDQIAVHAYNSHVMHSVDIYIAYIQLLHAHK